MGATNVFRWLGFAKVERDGCQTVIPRQNAVPGKKGLGLNHSSAHKYLTHTWDCLIVMCARD